MSTQPRYTLLTRDFNVFAHYYQLPLNHFLWKQCFFHTEGGADWTAIPVGSEIRVVRKTHGSGDQEYIIRRETDYDPSHEETPQGV